jgi:RND family efflux transporter MFP subunit
VVAAERASVPIEREYRGELVANAAELAAQGSGRLLEVRVDLGDRFEEGDVLAIVDASETRRQLSEARAQVKAASASKVRSQAELDAAQTELKRAERLLAEQLISEQEVSSLRSQVAILSADVASVDAQREATRARVALLGEQLARAKLTAPFAGAVAERYLDPGAMVQPGTQVLRLVQGGPVKVRFRASEQHLGKLSVGVPLSVSTLATGERRFAGTVERISAEVSRSDRTVAVEGLVTDSSSELRAGMYATVNVQLGVLEGATLVPAQAMLERVDKQRTTTEVIWVVENEIAHERPATVLGRHQDRVAIADLPPGTPVVVFGQQMLNDGDRVQTVERNKP